MPSILPPASDTQDENALDVLRDFAPPCEYSHHDEVGTGPAVWAVTLLPDCCRPLRTLLFCDGCWQYRNSRPYTHCPYCRAIIGAPFDKVVRVERI